MTILHGVTGLRRKLFRPQVLRKLKSNGTAPPRARVLAGPAGPARVYRIAVPDRLDAAMEVVSQVWDQHFSGIILPHHKVLVKINLNSPFPYPASTSPDMLGALLAVLLGRGIKDIVVGDCSSIRFLPTRRVARKTGIAKATRGRARMACFDEESWVTIPLDGPFLSQVTVPDRTREIDRIIALANMKTHQHADFTFGMKLAVGFMHPLERQELHRAHLQEKAAEAARAMQADLTIIDGRTAFITGGPDSGITAEARAIIIGDNPLAVDLAAYETLYSLKKEHRRIEGFHEDPFMMRQFCHAREIGLGGTPWAGYRCAEVDNTSGRVP